MFNIKNKIKSKNLPKDDSTSNNAQNFRKMDQQVLDLLDGNNEEKMQNFDYDEEFVTIREYSTTDEFVIIENNKGRFKRFFVVLKFFLFTSLIIMSSSLLLFCSLFKVMNLDVKAATWKIYNYNIVSKNYKPNLDEIKSGDIIYIDKTPAWSPYIYEYEKLIYNTRNGKILFCSYENGKQVKIQSVDVTYIGQDN